MSKLVKFSPLLLGVIALVAFVIYLNLPQEQTQQKRRAGTTPVVTAKASIEAFPVVVEALGTATANESVNLTAQQAQIVNKIMFEDGQQVSAGQVIVELNNRQELARVNELNININEANRQLKRIKNLAKQSAASQQLLDEQGARVDALNAQKEVAEAQLSELQVTAPFAGTLGIREVSVGSLVRPGDRITTLDDVSIIKVDFSISESHLASLDVGQNITAHSIAYPSTDFLGKITSIDARIDPITRSIKVRAQIPNKERLLRPGMLLQINLEKRVIDALVISEMALVPEGEQQFVFVVNKSKAVKTPVTIGQRKPGKVQVMEGLSDGDEVVIEGTLRLRDGSAVEVASGDNR